MMQKYIKKMWKSLLAGLLVFAMILPASLTPVSAAETVDEGQDGIWTGWASCESGAEGGRSAGSDGGHAFGLFQFDDRSESLFTFMAYCMSEDPTLYGGFDYYYKTYKNLQAPYIAGSSDLTGMINTWHQAYDADPDKFISLQLDIYKQDYYAPVLSMCASKGIDLTSDNFSPVIRGTLWSISIWAGPTSNGVGKVIRRLSSNMTEEEMLDICYSNFTAEMKGANSKYIEAFRKRWTDTQKTLAANAYVKWSAGETIPTTESDNIAAMFGGAGMMYGIDGGSYIDYIREWLDKYQDITKDFRNGGWNTDNKDWAISLRNAGDFFDMYSIVGNGVELDLSTGTSGGMSISSVNVNAENYSVPDNGGSMPIVYFSQGQSQPWSALPFGDGNIASSGCSITSLSMVVSYLTGGTDRESWVYPSDIRAMIQSKTGNYNAFHVAGSGQGWDIFPAVAGYYGLHCFTISSASIVSALSEGKPVIMSCKPGEFTKKGHFIVLTGLTDDGYITVNDPSHPDKSFKKYPASFIAGQGKGWWAFSN